MSAVLQGDGLGVRRGGQDLLADATLALAAGRLTVLIGPNGAGKSTLLKVLSGETPPDAGRVLVNGEPLSAIPPWRLACIRAVLPQSVTVSMPFTAREIVRLGCDGVGRALPRAERDAIVEAALDQADASGLAGRVVHTLSGGEQQRVQFARVLCQLKAGRSLEPRQVLLLDEPIASLDLKHQIALLDHAARLARAGTAVLVILHDLNLAAAYADELVVLERGRIVARGAPEAVLTDARLRETFGLDLKVRAVPAGPVPFVLPLRRRDGA